MANLWFRLWSPAKKKVELIDEDGGGARLTLVAWAKKDNKFAPVMLDRGEAKQMAEAIERWLKGCN